VCNNSAWKPVWDAIAADYHLSKGSDPNVVFGLLNCDSSTANSAFCDSLPIKVYPTFLISGYGNYYDSATKIRSMVTYPYKIGIVTQHIRDWAGVMLGISAARRKLSVFGRLFGRREKQQTAYVKKLQQQLAELEAQDAVKPALKSQKASARKSAPIDDGYDGDPFAALHELDYDEAYTPLIACVVDQAQEYCEDPDRTANEPFCDILYDCIDSGLAADECRPQKCPFKGPEGFAMVTQCLTEDVLVEYAKWWHQQKATLQTAKVDGSTKSVLKA
jgi:hypothetical protein